MLVVTFVTVSWPSLKEFYPWIRLCICLGWWDAVDFCLKKSTYTSYILYQENTEKYVLGKLSEYLREISVRIIQEKKSLAGWKPSYLRWLNTNNYVHLCRSGFHTDFAATNTYTRFCKTLCYGVKMTEVQGLGQKPLYNARLFRSIVSNISFWIERKSSKK